MLLSEYLVDEEYRITVPNSRDGETGGGKHALLWGITEATRDRLLQIVTIPGKDATILFRSLEARIPTVLAKTTVRDSRTKCEEVAKLATRAARKSEREAEGQSAEG
jgi:hypothetical protein